MSIIMCMRSKTLDWNLSKSAKILGSLPLYIKTKFQNKTKTKPRNFFDNSCRLLSLVKFWQVSYIIKNKLSQKMFYE